MEKTTPQPVGVITIVCRNMRPYLNLDGTYSIQVPIILNGEPSSVIFPRIFATRQHCQANIDQHEATGLITYGAPIEYITDLLPRT